MQEGKHRKHGGKHGKHKPIHRKHVHNLPKHEAVHRKHALMCPKQSSVQKMRPNVIFIPPRKSTNTTSLIVNYLPVINRF